VVAVKEDRKREVGVGGGDSEGKGEENDVEDEVDEVRGEGGCRDEVGGEIAALPSFVLKTSPSSFSFPTGSVVVFNVFSFRRFVGSLVGFDVLERETGCLG
jgi:hypothetical protein